MSRLRFNPEWTFGNLLTAFILLIGAITTFFATRAETDRRIVVVEERQNQVERQLKMMQETQNKMADAQTSIIRVQDKLTFLIEARAKTP